MTLVRAYRVLEGHKKQNGSECCETRSDESRGRGWWVLSKGRVKLQTCPAGKKRRSRGQYNGVLDWEEVDRILTGKRGRDRHPGRPAIIGMAFGNGKAPEAPGDYLPEQALENFHARRKRR